MAASGVITIQIEVTMKTWESKKIGVDIAKLVWTGEVNQAYDLLASLLAQQTRFPKLSLIGEAVRQGSAKANRRGGSTESCWNISLNGKSPFVNRHQTGSLPLNPYPSIAFRQAPVGARKTSTRRRSEPELHQR